MKVHLMISFHKNVRLIFHKKPFYPKIYVLNIDERKLVISPGSFLIFLEHRFFRALVNLWLLEFAIYLSAR